MSTTLPERVGFGAVDRLVDSATNYWVALFSDIAAALAFLALGLHRFSGSPVSACGFVIAGLASYSWIEYAVHRWILHGPFPAARRGHARHHGAPRALISTPLFVIMTAAVIVWLLGDLFLPRGVSALVVFGLYASYNYFALLHHVQHHRGAALARVTYWRHLERHHHVHHHQPIVNFGISTTIWDRLFGTFDPHK